MWTQVTDNVFIVEYMMILMNTAWWIDVFSYYSSVVISGRPPKIGIVDSETQRENSII